MKLEDHLRERYFDTNLHSVWLDNDERVVTYPVWNLSGKMVGYQQYRPDADKEKKNSPREGRYFSYKAKYSSLFEDGPFFHRNTDTVFAWGLESWNLSNTLFVTEGVFDASRLTWNGYSAVAVIANKPNKSTLRWLCVVRQMRPVVVVCDDDAAGLKLRTVGHDYHVVKDGKDLGDASDKYVEEFLKGYN